MWTRFLRDLMCRQTVLPAAGRDVPVASTTKPFDSRARALFTGVVSRSRRCRHATSRARHDTGGLGEQGSCMEAVSGYQGPGLGERSVRLAELDGGLAMRCGVLGLVMAVVVLADARGRVTSRGRPTTTPPVQSTWVRRRLVNRIIRGRQSNLDAANLPEARNGPHPLKVRAVVPTWSVHTPCIVERRCGWFT